MEKDFIKTLEKSIDSMPLYNTLSTFGNVMSCKPVSIKNGCRGLGYVHIEKSEAKTGIKRLTRMLMNGQQLFTTHHEHEDENRIIMSNVNSKQVDASQAQKKEKGHPKHQFEQIPTDTYTSIRQDKPQSSTQDIQLQ
ncbi:polyadenylate-binding protein 1-like, partial [Clarias magur]